MDLGISRSGGAAATERNKEELLESLVYRFPERKLEKNARKKTPYAGPSTFDYAKQTNLLGFTTTLSSSDEEQEAGARFKLSELPKRREEERKAAAAYSATAAIAAAAAPQAEPPVATTQEEETPIPEEYVLIWEYLRVKGMS